MTNPRTPDNRPGPPTHARPQPQGPAVHHVARIDQSGLARPRRGKPDWTGARMVIGIAGLASASAIATAMIPSITPQTTAVSAVDTTVAQDPTQQPDPSVIHVTHVVTLAPGQTLPPDALVNQTPAAASPRPKATPRPTPRIIIQTITRQSGKP